MAIKNSMDSIAKNMIKSTAKRLLAKNSIAKDSKSYYYHNNKRSQAKNHASVINKIVIKDNDIKICGYDEKGLLVGWGINHQVVYSRVDNECIAGWFNMMCENDNRVVGEILRSVEEYKERHNIGKEIVGGLCSQT